MTRLLLMIPFATIMSLAWNTPALSQDIVWCSQNRGRNLNLKHESQCGGFGDPSSKAGRLLTYELMETLFNRQTAQLRSLMNEQADRNERFRQAVSQQVNTLAARINSVQSDILDELAKLEEREASAVGVPDLRRRVDELGQIVRELQREMATLDGETPEN